MPYTKVIYKMSEISQNAEKVKKYQERKTACAELKKHLDSPDAETYLWKAIEAFENYLIPPRALLLLA